MSRRSDPADPGGPADAPSGLVAPEHPHYEDAVGVVTDYDQAMADQGCICPVCGTSLLLGDVDPGSRPVVHTACTSADG